MKDGEGGAVGRKGGVLEKAALGGEEGTPCRVRLIRGLPAEAGVVVEDGADGVYWNAPETSGRGSAAMLRVLRGGGNGREVAKSRGEAEREMDGREERRREISRVEV